MPNKKGVGTGAVIGVVFLLIIVGVIYLSLSGNLNLGSLTGGSGGNTQTSAFTTSVSAEQASVLQGHSTSVVLQYFNPFSEPVSANIVLNVGSSSVITPSSQSRSVSMIAAMPASATVSFNLSCTSNSANQVSTSSVLVYVSNFVQNASSDVVTYPYGSAPQAHRNQNNMAGFLTITATPLSIVTGGSSSATQSMVLTLTPTVYSGVNSGVYTGAQSVTPNNVLSSLTISIDNTEGGVSSADLVVNGNQEPFTVSGHTLTLTVSNINLGTAQYQLPLQITAASLNVSTQNVISITTTYNYQYLITGPTISCQ